MIALQFVQSWMSELAGLDDASAQDAWDLLTALRGPDNTDSGLDLKGSITAKIRRALCTDERVAEALARKVGCDVASPYTLGSIKVAIHDAWDSALKQPSLEHFLSHAQSAVKVLERATGA